MIQEASKRVGSQSIVAVMDIKKSRVFGRHQVFTHNGKRKVNRSPIDLATEFVAAGVGELLLNSIDRDGSMTGYDYDLIDSILNHTDLPITVLGGAGSFGDIGSLVSRYGPIGAAAGTITVSA